MEWKSILGDLLKAYLTQGLPFALVHAVLFAWFLFELGRLVWQAWALRKWNPGDQGSTTCTKGLASFLAEDEALASQGFLIPLTDFTDRLDSVVDGMLGRIHDLINLFLVVGIAGTVLGLFHFAVHAASAESPKLGESLAQGLIHGLKTAFPVAFVGLGLYVLGYIMASFPEHFLRGSLTQATDRVLEKRRAFAKSQAELIRESLAPLKNLETTLSKAVQPAIAGFQSSLNGAFQLIQSQMAVLQQAVKAVQDSVQSVEKGVQSLQAVSDHLRLVLADAPNTLKKIDDLHEQQVKRLQELSHAITAVEQRSTEAIQKLGATAGHFSSVLEGFQGLPEQLRQQLASGLTELFSGTVTQLSTIIREFEGLPAHLKDSVQAALNEVSQGLRGVGERTISELRDRVVQLIGGIETSSGEATLALGGAADRLRDVAQQAHQVLARSFDEAVNSVTKKAEEWLPRLEEMFANKVPNALGETGKLVEGLRGLVSQLDEARRSLGELLSAIDSRIVGRAPSAGVEPILAEVRQCTEQLERMTRLIGLDSGSSVLSSIAEMESKVVQRMDQLVDRSRQRTFQDWRLY